MVCRGAACLLAAECPFGEPHFAYTGCGCPLQTVWFFRRIEELTAPLQEVGSGARPQEVLSSARELVRRELQAALAEQRLGAEGLLVPAVAGVAEQTGQPFYRPSEHPLLQDLDRLRRQLQRLRREHHARMETFLPRAEPPEGAAAAEPSAAMQPAPGKLGASAEALAAMRAAASERLIQRLNGEGSTDPDPSQAAF